MSRYVPRAGEPVRGREAENTVKNKVLSKIWQITQYIRRFLGSTKKNYGRFQEASGRPQEASGGLRRPSGGHRRPPEGPRAPQEASRSHFGA